MTSGTPGEKTRLKQEKAKIEATRAEESEESEAEEGEESEAEEGEESESEEYEESESGAEELEPDTLETEEHQSSVIEAFSLDKLALHKTDVCVKT